MTKIKATAFDQRRAIAIHTGSFRQRARPSAIHSINGKPTAKKDQFGTDWRWTRWQTRYLILWYHVDPDGRFTYRSGIVRGAKGCGKDPMAAAMCILFLMR